MEEDYEFLTVDRISTSQLSFKRRSGSISALGILLRAKYLRVVNLIESILDDSDSDDSDDSDNEENEDEEEENEVLEEIEAIYLQMIVDGDVPRSISIRKIPKKTVTVDNYSDDECWRHLRFRKCDIGKLIELLNMPPFLISPDRHKYSKEVSMIVLYPLICFDFGITVIFRVIFV
jgi:hypothetical protein